MIHITIIGVPLAGKTTIFNALKGKKGKGKNYNIVVVEVPDKRLDKLFLTFPREKKVYTEVECIDLKGIKQSGKGLGEEVCNLLRPSDAFILVVPTYTASTPLERINLFNQNKEAIETELLLSDLEVIEKRWNKIKKSPVAKLPPKEKLEYQVIETCKNLLEKEKPLNLQEWKPEERKILNGFQLLSLKPLITVENCSEDNINTSPLGDLHLVATIEEELSSLSKEEAEEFLISYGISGEIIERLIEKVYQALYLVTFYTIGEKEVRAWPLPKGSNALLAAEKIHTDMARGFIKAEVINWKELIEIASFSEARRLGILRLEGKDYLVQDGDVVYIKFQKK